MTTDNYGLSLQPRSDTVTARTLLVAFDAAGWEHNGDKWGISGGMFTYTRPWQRGETEIVQVCLDDQGRWPGAGGGSWWTIDRVAAILALADGRHWLECDDHYRESTRNIDTFGHALRIIRRDIKADFA